MHCSRLMSKKDLLTYMYLLTFSNIQYLTRFAQFTIAAYKHEAYTTAPGSGNAYHIRSVEVEKYLRIRRINTRRAFDSL